MENKMIFKFKYNDKNSVLKFSFGYESSFLQFLYVTEWKLEQRAYTFK